MHWINVPLDNLFIKQWEISYLVILVLPIQGKKITAEWKLFKPIVNILIPDPNEDLSMHL